MRKSRDFLALGATTAFLERIVLRSCGFCSPWQRMLPASSRRNFQQRYDINYKLKIQWIIEGSSAHYKRRVLCVNLGSPSTKNVSVNISWNSASLSRQQLSSSRPQQALQALCPNSSDMPKEQLRMTGKARPFISCLQIDLAAPMTQQATALIYPTTVVVPTKALRSILTTFPVWALMLSGYRQFPRTRMEATTATGLQISTN